MSNEEKLILYLKYLDKNRKLKEVGLSTKPNGCRVP
jgi:hypothetical protein